MFQLVPGRHRLGVHPEHAVAVIESINSPNVSVPGFQTEPAKGYILGARISTHGFSVFVYLHLLDSNSVAIYRTNRHNVPVSEYPSVEGEAIQFLESMGFMLDNLNFRSRSPAAKQQLAKTLPVFLDEPLPTQSASLQNTAPLQNAEAAEVRQNATGAFGAAPPPVEHSTSGLTQEHRQALGRLLSSF